MSKYTLEEKRLERLRRQLYGKQDGQTKPQSQPKISTQPKNENKNEYKYEAVRQDMSNLALTDNQSHTAFLKKDLLKITYISLGALSLQLLLYWSLSMKLVHF